MEGVAAILESVGKSVAVRRKRWGTQHKCLSGNAYGRNWAGSGPWFGRKQLRPEQCGSLVTGRGGKGQGGNRQALIGGTARNRTEWLGESPLYWKGAGST